MEHCYSGIKALWLSDDSRHTNYDFVIYGRRSNTKECFRFFWHATNFGVWRLSFKENFFASLKETKSRNVVFFTTTLVFTNQIKVGDETSALTKNYIGFFFCDKVRQTPDEACRTFFIL